MAALVPAIALIVKGPTKLPSSYLLLSLAFAVSWVADSVAWALGGSWGALYIAVPIQIGLVLMAVTDRRMLALGVLGVLAVASMLTFPGPEILVTVVGSTALLVLVRGEMFWPVYLYFGLGTILYMMMVTGEFTQYWYGYQASRLGAFAVFVALVVRGQHARVLN